MKSERIEKRVMLQLMGVSFLVSTVMAFQLFESRALLQLDSWFQADPDLFLSGDFSEAPLELKHPGIGLVVGVPLAIAERILSFLRGFDQSPIEIRHWLVLMMAPIASAVRTMFSFRALLAVTQQLPAAALLSVLDIVSFQAVAIGSIPETFPLSAAAIAAMFWLAFRPVENRHSYAGLWILAGVLAVSVTLTNAAPFAVLLLTMLVRKNVTWPRLLGTFLGTGLAVFSIVLGLVAVRATLRGETLRSGVEAGSALLWMHSPSTQTVKEIAWAMGHTFLAPRPTAIVGNEPQTSNPDHDFQIVYPPTYEHGFPSWWRALATVGFLLLGLAGYLAQPESRAFVIPAAAILSTNVMIHLFYGHFYFLYGLHWQFSMVWVMAGIAFLPLRFRTPATWALVGFVAVTAVNSFTLSRALLDQLWAS